MAGAVAAEFARLEQACRRAFGQRRYKEVLESCARAFDAKPDAADIAVLIAETEFDRGRASAALGWARKAVAVDPNLADAYVYIGSAEQQSGHAQAAKTAYLKYLELAPKGRYAQDIRAVVRGL
jgi:tetratricopeptide (TPR) repeat protein